MPRERSPAWWTSTAEPCSRGFSCAPGDIFDAQPARRGRAEVGETAARERPGVASTTRFVNHNHEWWSRAVAIAAVDRLRDSPQ